MGTTKIQGPAVARRTCSFTQRRITLIVGLCALLLLVPGISGAQLSLNWYTFDGGGYTFSTGGPLSLGNTVGQPDAGMLGSADYVLSGGFWLTCESSSGIVGPGGDPTHGGEGDPDIAGDLPTAFRATLGLNNPFVDRTGIRLDLPEACPVEVRVFDYCGRLILRLYTGVLPAGYHHLVWDGTGRSGESLPSGSYLLQVRAGTSVTRKRVVLLR